MNAKFYSAKCTAVSSQPCVRSLRFEPLEQRRLLTLVTVNTLSDTVDISDGLTSLREAIAIANTEPGLDTIDFAESLTAAGQATILLQHGELAITESLTINGPGLSLLTIDASGNDSTPDLNDGNGSRIYNVDDGTLNLITATFSGLTLIGGDVLGSGGAVLAINDNLEVLDCAITDNSAGETGGGISTSIRNGHFSVVRSIFSGNSSGTKGGALYINSLTGSPSTITDSRFADNTAGTEGGGMYVRLSTVQVARSAFSGNTAGSSGGGIHSLAAFPLQLQESTVSGNFSAGDGGGITASSGGNKPIIESSTISGNQANRHGGGVFFTGQLGGIFQRSTITGNVADADADGIGRAGGIAKYFDAPLSLDHSIVAGNLARSGDSPDVSVLMNRNFSVVYSLIGDNAGSSLAEAAVGLPDANGNLIGGPVHGAIDPLLGPLAHNGGPTQTHALLPGSPAINAGDPAAMAGMNGVPLHDQRGAPWSRIYGGRIDIGAFESQPNLLPGDYNFDGVVNAADYTIWRDTLGSTTDLRANGDDSNSVIDTADYGVWMANFGETPGATVGQAVPDISDLRQAEPDLLALPADRGTDTPVRPFVWAGLSETRNSRLGETRPPGPLSPARMLALLELLDSLPAREDQSEFDASSVNGESSDEPEREAVFAGLGEEFSTSFFIPAG